MGSDLAHLGEQAILNISIHAPRMGSDIAPCMVLCNLLNFNPRSPHGERLKRIFVCQYSAYFNPRSPHGERRVLYSKIIGSPDISIHAPRMGSDFRSCGLAPSSGVFQSTLPAWGATARFGLL